MIIKYNLYSKHGYIFMNLEVKKLIDFFGGQVATAKALDRTQALISKLLNNKAKVSPLLALKAENATNGKVKAIDLCPKLKELER